MEVMLRRNHRYFRGEKIKGADFQSFRFLPNWGEEAGRFYDAVDKNNKYITTATGVEIL